MAPSSVLQEWHSSGSCPTGTIPIRRLPKNAVNPDMAMIQPFHPSSHRFVDGSNSPTDEFFCGPYTIECIPAQFAVAVGLNWPYHGASALLPSYRPTKIEPHEISSTCIVIAATVNRTWVGDHGPGDFPPDVTNQIVVGLMASTSIFGNDNPNLYVYYTSDGGKRNRCFNFLCHGFIQTSSKIALGTSFINGGSSITYEGVPYVAMSIHKVPGQQQWWVSVNDTIIGYFPHTLFPTFFPESYINQLGGIVRNSRPNGVHTDTTMGNGRTPENGGSAVIKAYLAVAANGMDKKDIPVTLGATAPKCYDATVLGENLQVPGYDIAYGGPGGSGCDQ
ncbi:hypothetical protein EJB05_29192, partial [Eragrostis curvula]